MEHWMWDINPIIVAWGPIQIRYYGILFALVLIVGMYFWRRYLLEMKYPDENIYMYFYITTILGVVGARIGHCLFYEPARYLADPVEILFIWKGGLASHGGTIGILAAVFLYAFLYRIPFLVVADGASYGAVCAAMFVRLGNFFNSEIVGRVTDVPWAVRFPRCFDRGMYARHPTQLYEFAYAFGIFIVLLVLNRKLGTRKPRGLMMGVFLVLYFLCRFMVEFVKEYQTLAPDSPLTMGQYLSIPFFILGWVFLCFAWRERGRLTGRIPPDLYRPDQEHKR